MAHYCNGAHTGNTACNVTTKFQMAFHYHVGKRETSWHCPYLLPHYTNDNSTESSGT